MPTPDSIQTIAGRVRIETKVRGSRFIATAIPISSREEISDVLEQIRKEFWDASHHCYAYQLSPDGADYRFFDDGEPSGSAGKPILLVLQRAELFDVLLVVTRYFGGTKLGVGGLARAYGEAAQESVSEATLIRQFPIANVRVFTPYDDVGEVRRLLEEYSDRFEEEFKDVVIYSGEIRLDRLDTFSSLLTERTSGRAGLVNLDIVDAD